MKAIKVELLDSMGSDLDVVKAARVSFDKESEWEECISVLTTDWEERELWLESHQDINGVYHKLKDCDKRLIKYLATHNHWTPFAHTALKFRVAAPVPIRTQCFKHKVGLVENEESRRYISTTPEIFVPEFFRSKPEGSIKQGSAGKHELSGKWVETYTEIKTDAVNAYMQMVEDGICPEQARFVLPQGAIVNWIWTGNLVSFANFYLKRTDTTAQKEVQVVAKELGKLVEQIFPVSWKALVGEK